MTRAFAHHAATSSCSQPIGYTYDALDRRRTMTDATGTTTLTLDGVGRIGRVEAPSGTIAYGYDDAGRRIWA
jgi:uncharacterized protein RhaS with RHS repeats